VATPSPPPVASAPLFRSAVDPPLAVGTEPVAAFLEVGAQHLEVARPARLVAEAVDAKLDPDQPHRLDQIAGEGEDLHVFLGRGQDRKSTRLNSSHVKISY